MIVMDSVTKTYTGGVSPISGFSLEIREGETVILSGESGSGKSTLLSLMAALIRPTSGDITIDGKKIAKLPEDFAALYRRENIGIIFQSYHLLPHLTAVENICVPLLPTGLSMKDITAKAMNILSSLNMADKANVNVSKLSGGEQQRTAIARALINNPKIILADEPTANLDRKLTDSLTDTFRRMSDEGRTLVIATHDSALTEALPHARIISIGHGI